MGDGSDMLRLLSDLWVIIFMVQSYVIVMAISWMCRHGCYIMDAMSWMVVLAISWRRRHGGTSYAHHAYGDVDCIVMVTALCGIEPVQ